LLLACIFLTATCFDSTSEAAVQKPETDNLDIPKIDLLLSGGGLRASAFSYGVMAGLNEICVSAKDAGFTSRKKDDQGELLECDKGTPLLDQVNIISAVSGGAITAAYFKSHREEFFEEFPKLLKKSNLQWRLLKAEKSPTWKRTLRSPVFLLTSIWDTIGAILSLPLSLFNLNIELTPIAVMALSDGLLESEQLTTVYKDLFYQGTRLEDLSEKNGFPFEALTGTGKSNSSANDPTLLINATDITNGTVFTFDERTFECMGVRSKRGSVELALAVAASSSLPGVFSPVRLDDMLKDVDPVSIPKDCSPTLANRLRKPVLVDGGVTDNLGAIGLLRTVIKKKEDFLNRNVDASSSDSDVRKEKHFLLFVNSEAEAESKLPGLAGHFDASYDVLIRSKKDLVRVMASDMFNHFGFAKAELRLSDLVTHEPGVNSIVSRAVERLEAGTIKAADMPQVVPQSMTATDQEQKIKRDLDQVGMIPSPEEIDTLIAAGRKIALLHLHDLKTTYSALHEKTFESSCSGIHNPDKFWCWPSQFRSHDLDSGGGSAFLEVLTGTTKEFVEQTAKTREKHLSEIRQAVLRMVREESIYPDNVGSIPANLASIKEGLELDNELLNLYETAQMTASPPKTCMNAIQTLPRWIEGKLSSWKSGKDTTKDILPDLVNGLKEKWFPDAKCSPYYYFLQTIPIQFQSNISDQPEQFITILQQGIRDADPRINLMLLHHFLGFHLINYFSDFNRGLKHIKHAIEMARMHENNLKRMRPVGNEDSLKIKKQIERMLLFQRYNQLALAQYIPLAPTAQAADIRDVADDEVLRWERKNFPYRDGVSILEIILDRGLDSDSNVKNQLNALSESLERRMRGKSQADRIFQGIEDLRTLSNKEVSLEPCGDKEANQLHAIHRRVHAQYCDLVQLIRKNIRMYLAESAGLIEAGEHSRLLHAEYLEFIENKEGSRSGKEADTRKKDYFNYIGPEILATHGFVMLSRNMETPCPARETAVRGADALFLQAIEDFKTLVGEKPGLDLTLKRFEKYHSFAQGLTCPGTTH
jgi:predicted acylesterase/phospholipase RssA